MVIDYGIDNRLVRRQVEALIKYQELIPADIKSLFELILGPTSYMLFLKKWQERLEGKQLDNLNLPDGDPLRYADLDQLMGQGRFVDSQRQAMIHPRILAQSKAAALEAFNMLPQVRKPRQPYLQIKQEENEPFLRFVDRIKEGVEAAPDVPHTMKDTLLKQIATQNANITCKRLLATLPPDAPLLQIIETHSRAPIEQEKEKARIHASALAAALTKVNKSGTGNKIPYTSCFQCGQTGHLRKQCPQRLLRQQSQTVPASPFAGTCRRCDKFGHKANECRSKFKKDGSPLQGNGMSHVGGAATSLINPPATVAASSTCSQPLLEAQESTW